VSEAGSVLFGRAELERAFTVLGERLVRRGVVADIFIVGGAAMALAYDAARVTRDVDAIFKPHGIVPRRSLAGRDGPRTPPLVARRGRAGQELLCWAGDEGPGRAGSAGHPAR
jgi:hypothetical protein